VKISDSFLHKTSDLTERAFSDIGKKEESILFVALLFSSND